MKTFSIEGAAAHLNVSPDTMRDLAANGDVAGAKIGKAWVFTDEDLDEYLRKEIKKQTAARRNEPADKSQHWQTCRNHHGPPSAGNRPGRHLLGCRRARPGRNSAKRNISRHAGNRFALRSMPGWPTCLALRKSGQSSPEIRSLFRRVAI